ncbi:MAG: transcriptional regulator FilR1 domain-containing protein [Methanothrix sp.]
MTLASSILASLLAGQQPPSLEPAALNQLSRFKAKGWISVHGVKGNRTYALTNVGRIVAVAQAQQKSTEAFIEAHRDFLQSHDISGIPDHLLPRLGELEGTICQDNLVNPMQSLSLFLRGLAASKEIYGLSPNMLDGYAQVIADKVLSGCHVELIMTDAVYEAANQQYPDWSGNLMAMSNFKLYVIPKATLAFTVTDEGFNMGLPRTSGEYDLTSDLVCGQGSLSWGMDLFEWYKRHATLIEPIEHAD